ncbi:MAG: response regulator [Planctomycetes bacterium]|nr:response regulator [Planctomycetota bacterium]
MPTGARVVLVVDDDVSVQNLVEAVLAGLGVDGVIAPDGESGIACLDTVQFDLALVDLDLPGMSGVEVARHVREKGLTCTVVGMSGVWTDDTRAEMMALGAVSVLDKPISIEPFARLLSMLLGLPSSEGVPESCGAVLDRVGSAS